MADRPGFRYRVSDEQLAAFRSLSPARRLAWLDEMREISIKLAPARAKASWRRLRRERK